MVSKFVKERTKKPFHSTMPIFLPPFFLTPFWLLFPGSLVLPPFLLNLLRAAVRPFGLTQESHPPPEPKTSIDDLAFP